MTIGFTFLTLVCGAQSIERNVISAAGESYANGAAQVSFTIGEPITETASGNDHSLTQGFHQTQLFVTGIEDFRNDLNVQVFPNPTVENLTIQIPESLKNGSLVLYTTDGKVARSTSALDLTTTLDVSDLSSGMYFLNVIAGTERIKTFKVVKQD